MEGGNNKLMTSGITPPPNKVKDVASLLTTLAARLAKIGAITENMTYKRGKIYIEWLKSHAEYLRREVGFNPRSMRRYKRGEIVFINFGFNVGSEIGGAHFAVVTTDSEISSPVINVVPLGSLNSNQNETNLHKKEVYLGVIPGMNGLQSYAIPNQLQPVSKMKILSPTSKRDPVIKIENEMMDKIDKMVVSLYVKGYVSQKELDKQNALEEIRQGEAQVATDEA